MGALFTKKKAQNESNENEPVESPTSSPLKLLDPRSPNPFRTPLSDITTKKGSQTITKAQDLRSDNNISTAPVVTPTKLQTKLLRDLGYTLDPRSPTVNIDRTPLRFENDYDTTHDSDDSLTFYDSNTNSFDEIEISTENQSNTEENVTTEIEQLEIDPRSPSLHIERTPLTLDDEEEEKEILNLEIKKNITFVPIKDKSDDCLKNSIYIDDDNDQQQSTPIKIVPETVEGQRTPLSCLMNSRLSENRTMANNQLKTRTNLSNAILKSAHHNTMKMNNSLSKIPVYHRHNSE